MLIGVVDNNRLHVLPSESGVPLPEKVTEVIEAYTDVVACVVECVEAGDPPNGAIELGWYLLETSAFSPLLGEDYGQERFRQEMLDILNKVMK